VLSLTSLFVRQGWSALQVLPRAGKMPALQDVGAVAGAPVK
jgi:hypothetical protein